VRRSSLGAVVLATAALLTVPAAATTPTYSCHGFNHVGYTAYGLQSKGVDCGTFTGFAKRIVEHGTGFLVNAKWTCHEAEAPNGHGYVHCEKQPYLSLEFHFHLS
jgi:hypothetical protein